MKRNILIGTLALSLTVASFVVAGPSLAGAGTDPMLGKSVVVLMSTSATANDVVEDLSGTVKAVDASGMLLAATNRTLITNGTRSDGAYENTLFVPWTSVLYVKIK